MAQQAKPYVHPTAVVEDGVKLGNGAAVWHFCHVRKGTELGSGVLLGKDVYIDANMKIGKGTRIQNGVSLFHGVKVGDWCFIGPHVIFTNDMFPRAGNKNWKVIDTHLKSGSAIGAGAIIRCGVTLGEFSMVGAGAIVTKSVPPFTLVIGFPARPSCFVCACGQTQFPLSTKKPVFLRPCCKENLADGLYKIAKKFVEGFDFKSLPKMDAAVKSFKRRRDD